MKDKILTDSRIVDILPLSSPKEVVEEIPQSERSAATVIESRREIERIVGPGRSSGKLLVVVGPCSIHDEEAALEYARFLKQQRDKYSDDLEIVMRTYLEKPRTTVGWKGIINDPDMDDSCDINKGLRTARRILSGITDMGLPVSYELLSTRTPQYIADLISWGAIGARTSESQPHRELVSGVSFPVGYKNGTGGSIQIAIDAISASKQRHVFPGIDMDGKSAAVHTTGNTYCHIILRGSSKGPNYDAAHVRTTVDELSRQGLSTAVMIDCSHANSEKDYRKQETVLDDVVGQISRGDKNICGVMIESNLVEGRQDIGDGNHLVYGQSITDACVGLDVSARMLAKLAAAAKTRS